MHSALPLQHYLLNALSMHILFLIAIVISIVMKPIMTLKCYHKHYTLKIKQSFPITLYANLLKSNLFILCLRALFRNASRPQSVKGNQFDIVSKTFRNFSCVRQFSFLALKGTVIRFITYGKPLFGFRNPIQALFIQHVSRVMK
jgi:hypothetical protein